MATGTGLTADEVRALLAQAGVDRSGLCITDDPTVWTDIESGVSRTSVRIEGPEQVRRAAQSVLFRHGFAVAPYPDHDEWSR